MNKITLLLLAFVLTGYAAVAQRIKTGNLTVFSEDGSKFFLELNGLRYNTVAQTNVRVEELPNPYYSCKIVFADTRKPVLTKKTLMLSDVDDVMQDVTYRIKKDRKGRRTLNFYSQAPVQQNMVRPKNCAVYRCGRADDMIMGADGTLYTQVTTVQQTNNESFGVNMGGIGVSVTAPGTTTTTTTTTTTGTGYGNQNGYNQNNGYNNGNGNGYNQGNSNGYGNTNGYNQGNNNGYNQNNNGYNQNNNNNGYGQNNGNNQNNNGYNNNGNNQNGYGNNNGNNQNNNQGNANGVCRVAMNSGDFESAKSAIKDNHFEDTKISFAKEIIANNCISAAQALAFVQLITFEEGRMDVAKYAYNFCIDKNNYYKVNSAFTFESSKTELNDYVKLQR